MRDSNNTKFFQFCLVLVITIVVSETFLLHHPMEAYARESTDNQLIVVERNSNMSQAVLESAIGAPRMLPATTIAMKADAHFENKREINQVSDTDIEAAAAKAQEAITEEEERKAREEEERRRAEEAAKAPKLVGQFKLTGYCPCAACCGSATGITSTGTVATAGRTIAANPSILPYGTVVYIEGYGTFTVEDTGHLGSYTLDVFFNSHQEALNFGVRYANVYIVNQ